MKSPIFIFSLPRSGSTLLQRVLMSHKLIASVAEPWLMLPLVYATKCEGALAEYSHSTSAAAVQDFVGNLPNDKQDYSGALNDFMSGLYARQCKNEEVYFLDKTPRYYLIIPEIIEIFPDAKFIFLFRNPLHALSSMVSTWSSGNLRNMYAFQQDVILGSKRLSEGYAQYSDRSIAIKYEDFVLNPEVYGKRICEYLELDFDPEMLSSFKAQQTNGRMGDPSGVKEYASIDTRPLNKWEIALNTPLKKRAFKNLIGSIEDEALEILGYKKSEILADIDRCRTSEFGYIKDLGDWFFSIFVHHTKANLFFGRRRGKWFRKRLMS